MRDKLYKYQGAGNDFIIVDARDRHLKITPEIVKGLCDRHFGIGADGFMMLEDDPKAQFYMRYFNADGNESTMCGNGARCISLFAHHLSIGDDTKVFNSSDGLHFVEIVSSDRYRAQIKLQMIDLYGYTRNEDYIFLNTGSPEYVQFVEDVDTIDVKSEGARIRFSDTFAADGGTNVNFVQRFPCGNLKIRTYERGVEDETLACGTGVTASALAANIIYSTNKTNYNINTRGGTLKVSFETSDNKNFTNIFLEGGATKVFECYTNIEKIGYK